MTKAQYPGRCHLLLALCLMILPAAAAAQQDLFRTMITVNDQAITQYEIDQRIRFLGLLRAPGDLQQEAREGLIEDRLRLSETRRSGIELSPDEIEEGMEEFAGRANLDREQFIAALQERGVSAETFRDFVSAGLAWRNLVRGRFGPRSQVTDAEVDRALGLASSRGSARVLLAEIIVPLNPQIEAESRALIERLSTTLTSESAFAAAARRHSASPTRERGGRLDWLQLGQVPPALRAAVLTLQPGEVSEPIELGPGIGIFQLRALEETAAEAPETLALEYATVLFPGGRTPSNLAAAQELSDSIDTCDDLYPYAKTIPAEFFERTVAAASDVASDVALELARLDSDEVSIALTRGEFLLFTMLCGRTLEMPQSEEGEDIDQRAVMRERLFQERITSFADSFLDELRADAIIKEQ